MEAIGQHKGKTTMMYLNWNWFQSDIVQVIVGCFDD